MTEKRSKKNKKVYWIKFCLLIIVILFIVIKVFTTTTVHEPFYGETIIKPDRSIARLELLDCKSIFSFQDNKQTSAICKKIIDDSLKNKSIELYRIVNLNIPRAFPDTIVLNDGTVLILGGDGNNIETAELFNPEDNTFTLLTDNLGLYYQGIYKYFLGPIQLPDGNVFYKGSLFDPKTKKFVKARNKFANKLIDLDKKYKNYFEQLLNPDNKKPSKVVLKVFEDGQTLLGDNCLTKRSSYDTKQQICSEIILEDPFEIKKYRLAKFSLDTGKYSFKKLPDNKIIILDQYNFIVKKIYFPDEGTIIDLPENFKGIFLHAINNNKLLFIKTDPTKLNSLQLFDLKLQSDKAFNVIESGMIPEFSLPVKLKFIDENWLAYISDGKIAIINYKTNNLFILKNPNIFDFGQKVILLKDKKLLLIGGSFFFVNDNKLSKFAAILSINNKTRRRK